MSEIKKIKKHYNNGEKFLNSDKFWEGTKEQQERWIKEFQKIAQELSRLRWDIEAATEKQMSKKEILEGFKEV